MRKKLLILTPIIVVVCEYLHSQNVQTSVRTFNFPDYTSAKSICKSSDDGMYLVGEFKTVSGGQSDIYIYKSGRCSNLEWIKYLGSSGNDQPYKIIQSSDGGLVLANGYDSGGGNGYEFSLIKTDGFGNLIWHTSWDNNNGNDIAKDVIQFSANFIAVGSTSSFPWAGTNGCISIYSSNGSHILTKAIGGSGNESIESITNIPNTNQFVAVGFTSSFGAGQRDILLVHFDIFGNINWIKTYGTSNNEGDVGKIFVTATNSNIFITASTDNSTITSGGEDILLLKLDLSGNLQWAKVYGGSNNEYGQKIYLFNNGLQIVGTTNSFTNGDFDACILRLDNNGNIIWSKSYGRNGCDIGESLIYNSTFNFYALSVTYNNTLLSCGSNNEYDPLIFKMDTTGNSSCNFINAGFNTTIITPNILVQNHLISSVTQDISSNINLLYPTPTSGNLSITENFNCLSCVNATPSFTVPSTTCQQNYIILKNQTPPSGNVCYNWYINGSYISSLDTVPITFNPGTFTIELQAVCGNSLSSLSQVINVNPKPLAAFAYTNHICIDKMPVQYINTGTTGFGINYQWYLGAGATPSVLNTANANNISYQYPGIKNVALVVYNSYGCKDSVLHQISIEPKPQLDFLISKNPVCQNDTFSITNLSWAGTGANVINYNWNFGDGNTSNIKNPVHSYTSSGTFSITLIGITDYGCDDTLQKSVEVKSLSNGGNVTPSSSVVCEGQNWGLLILNGFNGNVLEWQYSTDNGNTWTVLSNTSTIQGYYNLTNTTMYYAVVQNTPCPAAHSNTAIIIVDHKTVPGLLLKDTVVCFGSNSGVLSLQNYSTTIIDWIFSTDNGQSWNSTGFSSPSYTFTNLTDTTIFSVIVKNGVCPSDTSNYVTIYVQKYNGANVIPGDTTISLGYTIQLQAYGGTQYSWHPNYNISDSLVSNPFVWPLKDTTYTVIVKNNYGCLDTSSVRIRVSKDYKLVIANTLTPNGDNINDFFWIGYIESYPNNEVYIFNRYGQEIFKGNNYDNKKVYWDGTYQGTKVPDGAYYYVIKFKDNNTIFKGSINVISSH